MAKRKPKQLSHYVNRGELAKLLDVSTGTIDRWAKAGDIEPIPQRLPPGSGRRVLYDYERVCEQLGIEP